VVALARGHAQSGHPAEIGGDLGTDNAFDHAIGRFATAYADQNERDHAAFVAAIKAGRVESESVIWPAGSSSDPPGEAFPSCGASPM
jgi:hypothetical protein